MYCFPTTMNNLKVSLAWLWCPVVQMLATRWCCMKVSVAVIDTATISRL